MHNNNCNSSFLTVGGVSTQIVSLGLTKGDGGLLSFDSTTHLVVIIPGNPGYANFYRDFISHLYDGLDEKIPICAISHAGHSSTSFVQLNYPKRSGNEKLYDLKGQVAHKVTFFRDHIPKTTKLILIGHSIGCKIIIDLLKDIDQDYNVVKTYHLFPTIERMAETPQGIVMWPILNFGHSFVLLMCRLFRLFVPAGLMALSLKFPLWLAGMNSADIDPAFLYESIDPRSVDLVLFLAHDELKTVREVDAPALEKFHKKLLFYVGASDSWSPVSYWTKLKTTMDNLDIVFCKKNLPHAFVLQHSEPMAAEVVEWIKDELPDMYSD